MAVDALAMQASATMLLNMQDEQVLFFHKEEF